MQLNKRIQITIFMFMATLPIISYIFKPISLSNLEHKIEYDIRSIIEKETEPELEGCLSLYPNMNIIELVKSKAPFEENKKEDTVIEETTENNVEEITEEETTKSYISEDEMNLIALVVMAEADGQCEEGRRLVIDVILNRLDSPIFPNTVYDVIYQPEQFACMWNGRIDVCYVKEENLKLVKEELYSRFSCDAVFFRTKHFFDFGTPLFQVGAHYFSSL